MVEQEFVPELGKDLPGRIVRQTGKTEWEVECPALSQGWSAKLRSRMERLYEAGDDGMFWIYSFSRTDKLILLSDSNFGRMPFSDRMRPRYIRGLKSAIIVVSRRECESISADDLSEVKGMFNRCIRKDQWDWLTMYDAFGRPKISIQQRAADWFGGLASALRHREITTARRYVGLISGLELKPVLDRALSYIVTTTPHLNEAISMQPISNRSLTNQDEPKIDAESDPYIISQVARAKLEQANYKHQCALRILVEFLESNGFIVEYSRFVDAFCRLKTGPAIFEVKSITPENERSQSRQALSQLYEYRYLHSIPDASLWIILSEQPHLGWITDYLQKDRDVGVLWVEGKNLNGPGLTKLFEGSPIERSM